MHTQIPFDASVRVSLDTNLCMIKENPEDGPTCAATGRWYRDPSLQIHRRGGGPWRACACMHACVCDATPCVCASVATPTRTCACMHSRELQADCGDSCLTGHGLKFCPA
jgi:hypothetical protein